MYVSLTQSNADEQKLVASFDGEHYPTGAQNVDGVSWVVYEGGEGTRPVWTTRLDGPTGEAQIAITGAATGGRIPYAGRGHAIAAAAPRAIGDT